MSDQKDLREIGRHSNDTTKAVLETLQAARGSSDWPRSVATGLSRVWLGVENQNFVDDILEAMQQVGDCEDVVAWAFSDANDDLLGAAILAVWAFQRSGSRRAAQIVARGVGSMPPALRSSFAAQYKSYLEKAAWKLSGAGPWACYPDDAVRERREREQQREKNRRFCESNDIERLVGASSPLVASAGDTTTSPANTHDIFISYRRDGGEHLAGRVKDALKSRGFSVFMDVEDLKSGKFDEALLGKIQNATDVLVILTPGCLDRCKNEDDWLRLEIGHAIHCKRNIVPILARGFQMPPQQTLPPDIAELPKYNGLTPAHELFDASMDRLVATFLKAAKKAVPSHPEVDTSLDVTLTPQALARLAELVRSGTPEEVDQMVRGLKLTISPVAKRAASRFIDWLGRYNHPGYATIGEPLLAWLTADKGADQVAEDWTLFLRMVGCVLISTELKTGVRVGRIDNEKVELLGLPESNDWVPFIERDLFGEAVAENRIRKQSR